MLLNLYFISLLACFLCMGSTLKPADFAVLVAQSVQNPGFSTFLGTILHNTPLTSRKLRKSLPLIHPGLIFDYVTNSKNELGFLPSFFTATADFRSLVESAHKSTDTLFLGLYSSPYSAPTDFNFAINPSSLSSPNKYYSLSGILFSTDVNKKMKKLSRLGIRNVAPSPFDSGISISTPNLHRLEKEKNSKGPQKPKSAAQLDSSEQSQIKKPKKSKKKSKRKSLPKGESSEFSDITGSIIIGRPISDQVNVDSDSQDQKTISYLSNHFTQQSLLDIELATMTPITSKHKNSAFDRDLANEKKTETFKVDVVSSDKASLGSYKHITLKNTKYREIIDYDELVDSYVKRKNVKFGKFYVICGILNNCQILGNLIFHLRRDYFEICPIVIFNEENIKADLHEQIFCFPEIYFFPGNPNSEGDLVRIGIMEREAHFIVLSGWNSVSDICRKRVFGIWDKIERIAAHRTNHFLALGKKFWNFDGESKILRRNSKQNKVFGEILYSRTFVSGQLISFDFFDHWISKYCKKSKIGEKNFDNFLASLLGGVITSLSIRSSKKLQILLNEKQKSKVLGEDDSLVRLNYGEIFDYLLKTEGQRIPLGVLYKTKEGGNLFCVGGDQLWESAIEEEDQIVVLWGKGMKPAVWKKEVEKAKEIVNTKGKGKSKGKGKYRKRSSTSPDLAKDVKVVKPKQRKRGVSVCN